jgi:hypothetical protein
VIRRKASGQAQNHERLFDADGASRNRPIQAGEAKKRRSDDLTTRLLGHVSSRLMLSMNEISF